MKSLKRNQSKEKGGNVLPKVKFNSSYQKREREKNSAVGNVRAPELSVVSGDLKHSLNIEENTHAALASCVVGSVSQQINLRRSQFIPGESGSLTTTTTTVAAVSRCLPSPPTCLTLLIFFSSVSAM